ncbi:hypothetical protein I4U23_015737 [Adineta vaga]|nr:hypothetical protein I4U23_015737 [Adineta vaga]
MTSSKTLEPLTAMLTDALQEQLLNGTDNITQNAVSLVTKDNNEAATSNLKQHIMMSYHHDSSYEICEQICARLRAIGYRVWMDRNDLHGFIHQGMAEAIENAFVVLFFINPAYYGSEFCQKEVLYTDKKRIDFIPCLLEPSYEPRGWLGIVIRDRLYVDFSSSVNFDANYNELLAEIRAVETRLQISSSLNMCTLEASCPTDTSADEQISPDALRVIIREFRESGNRIYNDAQPMTEEEFPQFINYLRQRVFTNNLQLPSTENNNSQETLHEILLHSRNQTELLQRITDILSNLTETRTIIKLSSFFVLLCTISKFLQRK